MSEHACNKVLNCSEMSIPRAHIENINFVLRFLRILMSSRLMVAAVVFRLDVIWPDWLACKICQVEDLASHDFG
jgi:hypothetical protein